MQRPWFPTSSSHGGNLIEGIYHCHVLRFQQLISYSAKTLIVYLNLLSNLSLFLFVFCSRLNNNGILRVTTNNFDDLPDLRFLLV